MTEPLARIHEGRLQRLFDGGYIDTDRWTLICIAAGLLGTREPIGRQWADEVISVLKEHKKGNEDGIHGRPDPRA